MTNIGGNGLEQIQNLDNLKACGFSDEQARGILKAMSQNVAEKSDVEITKLELKRDIEEVRKEIAETKFELKRDIEKVRKEIAETKSELKRDIKELDTKIETIKSELKKDIKALEDKITLKMAILSGGVVFTILSCLVTLAKLGLLRPA